MKRFFRIGKEIISGVYVIKNLKNGDVYVGSSIDIYGRWRQHVWKLNNNKHHNKHLQNAWNVYGENNFDFIIVEKIVGDRDYIFEREQIWVNYYLYNNIRVYNHNKTNAKTPAHYITIDDIKNEKRNFSLEQFNNICDYLSNTNIPISRIAEFVGVDAHLIYEIYERVTYVELTKDMEFILRKKQPIKLNENDVKHIIKRMLNSEFDKDIAKDYNISIGTVKDIRNKKIWKELTKDIIFPDATGRYKPHCKPIIQYDLNMNFIAEYKSAREAEKVTGIGYKMISRVCNGERPYTHGFIFRFKDD